MSIAADKIRKVVAQLRELSPDSETWDKYRSELKAAMRELEAEQAWDKSTETDTHRDDPRQSYGSREKNSADGFAESLKLFNPTKNSPGKPKD